MEFHPLVFKCATSATLNVSHEVHVPVAAHVLFTRSLQMVVPDTLGR
jgi:hypothetical protein